VEEDFIIVTGITKKHVIYCNKLVTTIFSSPKTILKLALNLGGMKFIQLQTKTAFLILRKHTLSKAQRPTG
jgi:hypothetical protein